METLSLSVRKKKKIESLKKKEQNKTQQPLEPEWNTTGTPMRARRGYKHTTKSAGKRE